MTDIQTKHPALSALVSLLERAGYPRADVPLLHLADVFLDLSGEDIRRRLYLTQDAEGRELCLRPEFTIPLCAAEVARNSPSMGAALSYCGPVFRQRQGEPGEFLQAGVESLGRVDREAADAEILALALSAAKQLGQPHPIMRLGDACLINGVLDALSASPAFQRRLKRRLASGRPVAEAIHQNTISAGLDRYSGVMAALEGAGPDSARAFVGDMLSMSGVRASGGRSIDEITARFLSKAQAGNAGLDAEKCHILETFLTLKGTPDHVAEAIRQLANKHGLDIANPLQRYEARIGFMAACGIDLAKVTASAGFVRNLDYYTGMVFEVLPQNHDNAKPLVGGGRYDGLMQKLGAKTEVPAVGFAIWIERFGKDSPSNDKTVGHTTEGAA
jgi:ATP phosphoribosyltransferase regulatory subunit